MVWTLQRHLFTWLPFCKVKWRRNALVFSIVLMGYYRSPANCRLLYFELASISLRWNLTRAGVTDTSQACIFSECVAPTSQRSPASVTSIDLRRNMPRGFVLQPRASRCKTLEAKTSESRTRCNRYRTMCIAMRFIVGIESSVISTKVSLSLA